VPSHDPAIEFQDLQLQHPQLGAEGSEIPGLAKFAFGRDLIDTLQLPDYSWPHVR
jgi:hypothetical protein